MSISIYILFISLLFSLLQLFLPLVVLLLKFFSQNGRKNSVPFKRLLHQRRESLSLHHICSRFFIFLCILFYPGGVVFIHDFPFALAANDDDGGNGGAMRTHDTITRSCPFPKRKYFRFFPPSIIFLQVHDLFSEPTWSYWQPTNQFLHSRAGGRIVYERRRYQIFHS